MRENQRRQSRSQRHFIFFYLSLSLQLISGLADDPSGSKHDIKAEIPATSGGSSGLKVVFICLGLVTVVALSIFLLRQWQKKKREEQYARLLRLFEEDDELELELGLHE
ncbi:uncharacterized protein LOC131236744 [Magnolia sinica]|uniref:uncharacterized protein LOC131236744 n=1 Tax=Magnolia sinica TaxID=86752 RepID=UPI00265965A1|nr:uncharacterized protein LOC131236744 [Magnolia sinica]